MVTMYEIIEEANYILEHRSTVRATALYFKKSKSAIHHDLHIVLKDYNEGLHKEVQDLFDYNSSVKHIRGGQATKEKYQKLRKS